MLDNAISNMFSIIKKTRHLKIFFISFVLLFIVYSFLYGLWKIPVIEFGINKSSIQILDYVYLMSITILSSLLITLIKYERSEKIKAGSKIAGTFGITGGIVSAICPACQSISMLAFGGTLASLSLGFLVPYVGLLQLITVMFLGLVLYIKADSIYTKCSDCNIVGKMKIIKYH